MASAIASTATASAIASTATSISVTATITTSASVSSTASSTATTSSGIVDLNFLAIDHFSVQFSDGLVGSIIVSHGYKCVALFSVINISNFAASAKFTF